VLCPFVLLLVELALLLRPVVEVALAWLFAWLFAGVAGCDAKAAPGTAANASAAIKATLRIFNPPLPRQSWNSTTVVPVFGHRPMIRMFSPRKPCIERCARSAENERTAYTRLHDIVQRRRLACVFVGSHFRNSDLQGSALGRTVGRSVADNYFQPVGG
jgi:hypothetical protein